MTHHEEKHLFFEYLTCFTTGFAILVLELAAFRILAPYFGMSSYVTGIIINVILLALAVGYVLGGHTADRHLSWKLPYIVILLSAGYLTFVYLFYSSLLQLFSTASVIPGTVVAVTVFFFIPMVLLAFLPPYLIKLISSPEEIGRTTGRIYAVSTLGSILGGIATTFIFIPFLGSLTTFYVTVVLLFIIAVFGLVRVMTVRVFLLLLLFPLYELTDRKDCNCLFRGESEYNLITITEENERRYLKLNDGLGFHSQSLDPETLLSDEYYDYFLLPQMISKAEDTLILGNGAGTSMMQAASLFNTEISGVEIDPALTELGRTYFGLDLNGKLEVFNEDARTFMNKNRKKYDIILVDIYSGGPFVPFHVTTVEFYAKIRQSLTEQGIVAINIPFFSLGHELGDFYLNTIESVFPGRTYISGCVVYAFVSETGVDEIHETLQDKQYPQALSELVEKVVTHLRPVEGMGGDKVFSDDYAPVEMMTQRLLEEGLRFTSCEQPTRFP